MNDLSWWKRIQKESGVDLKIKGDAEVQKVFVIGKMHS
jgi:hypothetical protein